MYSQDGSLVAAGAVDTEAERTLDQYRKDMAYLRDSFGGVIVAAELVAIWLVAGPGAFAVGEVVLVGGVGAAAFIPYAFFARKAHRAKKDLKQLSTARKHGSID